MRLCVVNSLQTSKTLRNQTPYQKQYGRVLWEGGRTLRKGVFCLLSAFYNIPLLRTHLQTSVSVEALTIQGAFQGRRKIPWTLCGAKQSPAERLERPLQRPLRAPLRREFPWRALGKVDPVYGQNVVDVSLFPCFAC